MPVGVIQSRPMRWIFRKRIDRIGFFYWRGAEIWFSLNQSKRPRTLIRRNKKMSNSDVMSKVNHECGQATAKIRETAGSIGEMAGAAASAVGGMASQVATNLKDDADYLASSAGRGVQRIGEQISRSTPHTGVLGDASQSVARAFTESGEYMESSKLSGMQHDLSKAIRRNPIPTIVIAMGLGWCVSRMFKR